MESLLFSQNRLPWQRHLGYRKKRPDRSSAPKMLLFGVKIAKISPVDHEITCLREMIKNTKLVVNKLENNCRKLLESLITH